MSKIWKLFVSENKKTFKKTSTKIMIVLCILTLFGSVGFAKLSSKLIEYGESFVLEERNQEKGKEELKTEINEMKKELNDKTLDDETKNEYKFQIERLEFAIENDLNVISPTWYRTWKSEALEENLYLAEVNLNELKQISIDTAEIEAAQKKVDDIKILIKNDNFDGYIDLKKNELKQKLDNKEITKEIYDDEIETLDLQQKYRIKATEDSEEWKENILMEIGWLKESNRTGLDRKGKLLTEEKLRKQEDAIKIDLYRLENNMPNVDSLGDSRNTYDYMAPSFALAMLSIAIIVIAGSSISTEVQSGTIKFWSFTPNKRWKILFAKMLSVIFITVVLTVVLAIFADVVGGIFFKDNAPQDYLYIKNGEVKTIPHNLYTILYYLAKDIDIIFYMLFALMLSTVVRNTAMSIGFSIATFIGGPTIMSIISQFIKMDFIKFIPFNNMGLEDQIFPNSVSYVTMEDVGSLLGQTSLQFSLCVLGVCAILMLITMFDSFNKKDII